MSKKLLEITGDIVQAQVASTPMTSTEIASSLRKVFQTLQNIQKAEGEGTILAPQEITEEAQFPAEAPKTLVPQDSIQNDKVICLECGAQMKQLTQKHLAAHGMSSKEYKKKYGFSMKTPLAAKSLTKARSKAAKQRGLPEKLKTFIEARRQQKAEAAIPAATGTGETSKPKRTRLRKKKVVQV